MDQSLQKYYDFILSLEYFEIKKLNDLIEQEKDVDKLEVATPYAPIPDSFIDSRDYTSVWEPLFYEETKANIIKCMQTEVIIYLMQNYPSYAVNIVKGGEGIFYQLDLQLSVPNDTINTKDLVLMTTEEFRGEVVPSVFGLVEFSAEVIRINLKMSKEFQDSLKSNLQNKQPFFLKKITGLSTLEREFRALCKIDQYPLRDLILSLNNQTKENNYFIIGEKLDIALKSKYNQSQYDAIRQTLKTSGVTLIQGPPGTGKTKTVIGTVSVLLCSQQQQSKRNDLISINQGMEIEGPKKSPWMEVGYQDWREHIFDEVEEDLNKYFHFKNYERDSGKEMFKNDLKSLRCPEKILVCGPSNASVDEIIRKVLEEGLLDSNGISQQQLIVRIGDNFDPTLQHVSLESLVNQRLFEQGKDEEEKGRVRKEIISQAKIVFGTLSSAGSNVLLLAEQQFDTVIIDEAAQAVEISTLIPLQYGCKRLILIGDHNQLPATVFSKIALHYKYHQSLFERFLKQGAQIHMLDTQYRMHPLISHFISQAFYNSKLLDSPSLNQLIGSPQLYNYYTYSPVVVLHVKGHEEFTRNSYQNLREVDVILELFKDMQKKFPTMDMQQVGIVSPYSQQIWQIQKHLKSKVEIKTVDGFQGREKDVIIFSTVRSKFIADNQMNPKRGIGFLSDVRRMNVSLSRCRHSLIVVCDIYKISVNPVWKSLVQYAQSLGTCYRVDTENIEQWFSDFDRNPLEFQIIQKQEKQSVF